MKTDFCPSPALTAAANDLLELTGGLTNADTLFVAKRTTIGMQTMIVWGRSHRGIQTGEPLEIADKGAVPYRTTVPLPLQCDREQGVLGALRDNKKFDSDEEDALKRAASVLARLTESEQKSVVTERESELKRSRENAELTARQTGELLAIMGHEIRTPMNGIVAMSQLLKETGLTEEQRQYLQIIEDSQQSLLELVGSILDYGKLEARQMKLETAPMDLIGALEDTAYQFAAKAAQRSELELTLDLDLDPELILIGDVRKIRQVVSNLLSNAIKFTPAGEVRITARRLEGDGEERAWIEVCVCDTGIGISEAGIARLFHDYEQVHRPEEGDYGGTGLGLSISKRLVDLMGGKIWAEGRKGQGTRMTFVLPLEIGQDTGTGSADSAVEFKGRRLLLAASGSGTRCTLSHLAERLGIEVRQAGSETEAATALVHEGPFDLLLSDWELDEETIRQSGVQQYAPRTPLVLLLPLAHGGEAQPRAKASTGLLTKPVRRSELCRVLSTACGPTTA